jgi:hemin uptake protein HemP
VNQDEHQAISTSSTPPEAQTEQPPTYQKQDLFKGAKEVIIEHNTSRYRLRETKNGKLILNL